MVYRHKALSIQRAIIALDLAPFVKHHREGETMAARPNLIVILIDDLRFDEFGAGGHPYLQTPHIDRLAYEGALFTNAFHTTPLCSPNRASILTGQYASRHGIIDNVGRDAASHRLANYMLVLQQLGYETAHIGKWHMGNDASPRPGYDTWISFRGQGQLVDPEFFEDGALRPMQGYVTDLLKAQDGTIDLTSLGGYLPAARHSDLYRGCYFPPRPNVLQPEEVVQQKPAWREAFALKASERSQLLLRSVHAGTQEEIRCRAAMMASVDEGVGMLLAALARQGMLEHTCIVFLGDNGYFFGEHALGPERRFAYEEGIRSPFLVRYPPLIAPGTVVQELTLALDIPDRVL